MQVTGCDMPLLAQSAQDGFPGGGAYRKGTNEKKGIMHAAQFYPGKMYCNGSKNKGGNEVNWKRSHCTEKAELVIHSQSFMQHFPSPSARCRQSQT